MVMKGSILGENVVNAILQGECVASRPNKRLVHSEVFHYE